MNSSIFFCVAFKWLVSHSWTLFHWISNYVFFPQVICITYALYIFPKLYGIKCCDLLNELYMSYIFDSPSGLRITDFGTKAQTYNCEQNNALIPSSFSVCFTLISTISIRYALKELTLWPLVKRIRAMTRWPTNLFIIQC